MKQKEDVGTKFAHGVSTPRDWVRELTERARGGRLELSPEEARRLALTLTGLAATVEQLEAYVQRLGDQVRPAPALSGEGWSVRTDHMSEDDESNIIVAGRQVPFVQVGMIVHPDDCLNCERDGNPLWCSALVCDIHDDDETARFGMMATLLFRNGERREEPCDELRRRWRVARDFDQNRVYTGRWGATPRGSVWPVAEVNEEA